MPRTKSYNKLIDNFLVLSSFCEALLTSRGLLKALQKAICWVDRDFEISGKVEEGERQTWCEQEAKQIKKLINELVRLKRRTKASARNKIILSLKEKIPESYVQSCQRRNTPGQPMDACSISSEEEQNEDEVNKNIIKEMNINLVIIKCEK